MPISTCKACGKKYHFAAVWARTSPYYGPERCYDCNQGGVPESWARGVKHDSSWDSSPYKSGCFAHAKVRQSYTGDKGEYHRVRIREVHPNGSIITFCGKHFVEGEHTDKMNYTWTLQPVTPEVEDLILQKELREEIDKLWGNGKYTLHVEVLGDILEILRSN